MEIMIEKEIAQLLNAFMQKARDDARIGLAHMTLYAALLFQWNEKKGETPLYIFSYELMPLSKLAGSATYHRSIRQLHEYGYIKYVPSNNHFLGSLVYLENEENGTGGFLLNNQVNNESCTYQPGDKLK